MKGRKKAPARRPRGGECRFCGCTDEYGCPQGCSWADDEHTICSVCDELALELGYQALETLVELEGRITR